MCGRFTLKTPLGKWLEEILGEQLEGELPELGPRFNIAPTQTILVVVRSKDDEKLRLESVRWGLVPMWAQDTKFGAPLINARSETIFEKPAFRQAALDGRCAVIADGYYEWKQLDGKRKQPYWIHRPGEQPFAMAGLTATNKKIDPERPLRSTAIVTTDGNTFLSQFHDRMPVILESPRKAQQWLLPNIEDKSEMISTLGSASNDFFLTRRVSSWVGNNKHEDARCLEEGEV